MLPLRYTRHWQIAGAFVLLTVFVAAVIPAFWDWPEISYRTLFAFDKWLHAVTFLVLAVWFSGQYARRAYWRVALGLLAFGIAIELCQRMISYRTADLNDLMANVVGIVLGIGIALAGFGGWSLRIENWLLARRQPG